MHIVVFPKNKEYVFSLRSLYDPQIYRQSNINYMPNCEINSACIGGTSFLTWRRKNTNLHTYKRYNNIVILMTNI
jgi:hypothetical protein